MRPRLTLPAGYSKKTVRTPTDLIFGWKRKAHYIGICPSQELCCCAQFGPSCSFAQEHTYLREILKNLKVEV